MQQPVEQEAMSSHIYINKHLASLPNLPPPDPHVRAFHRSLPHYTPTPLISLPEIAASLGIRTLHLKNETSRLGLPAFKILGASWATARAVSKRLSLAGKEGAVPDLAALATAAQAAGLTLYAATEGNHGRAVARMAKYLGIAARIYVPSSSDEHVRGNLRSEGAEVVVCAHEYDDAVLATKDAAEKHADGNGLLISDTALEDGDECAQWIVDGYQTMFDEVEEQAGGVQFTHVLVPVGVGSLCQAVVTHFRLEDGRGKAKADVITVESEKAPSLKSSLEAGEMVSVETGYTICSGMCCGTV
jgi:diaminopropionate ammonia-lyase